MEDKLLTVEKMVRDIEHLNERITALERRDYRYKLVNVVKNSIEDPKERTIVAISEVKKLDLPVSKGKADKEGVHCPICGKMVENGSNGHEVKTIFQSSRVNFMYQSGKRNESLFYHESCIKEKLAEQSVDYLFPDA